ncbi:MAG: peptidylprolyl isomerase [Lachnospiraceae bacterium]|nr:peptidylprolyl isomerase [Lachnospiraceae bacterium]
MMLLVLAGCKKTENTGNTNVGMESDGEPTLSESAKKITQFKAPKKGDTMADIVIDGYGTITVKLFEKYAPKAVENFVTHAKDGYYDGTLVHRVIEDFMIQSGDPTGEGNGGESIWGSAFEDEITDDLQPYRGALCMANAGADTNGSQFFFVQADAASVQNLESLVKERYQLSLTDYVEKGYEVSMTSKQLERYLTYGGTPWLKGHHTVFGQMTDGFDVLDAVAAVKTAEGTDRPVKDVVIETIRIYQYGEEE